MKISPIPIPSTWIFSIPTPAPYTYLPSPPIPKHLTTVPPINAFDSSVIASSPNTLIDQNNVNRYNNNNNNNKQGCFIIVVLSAASAAPSGEYLWDQSWHHPPTILCLQAKFQLQTYCTSSDNAGQRKASLSNHLPSKEWHGSENQPYSRPIPMKFFPSPTHPHILIYHPHPSPSIWLPSHPILTKHIPSPPHPHSRWLVHWSVRFTSTHHATCICMQTKTLH